MVDIRISSRGISTLFDRLMHGIIWTLKNLLTRIDKYVKMGE